MPIFVPTPRKRFRKFLEQQLKLAEENGAPEAALLRAAIEGLVALNYGEARGMFAPSDKKRAHAGSRPYTIRKLKMQALGFGDLLIANKYKPAVKTVADAYGETAENMATWRKDKQLAKTTDPLMKSFKEGNREA